MRTVARIASQRLCGCAAAMREPATAFAPCLYTGEQGRPQLHFVLDGSRIVRSVVCARTPARASTSACFCGGASCVFGRAAATAAPPCAAARPCAAHRSTHAPPATAAYPSAGSGRPARPSRRTATANAPACRVPTHIRLRSAARTRPRRSRAPTPAPSTPTAPRRKPDSGGTPHAPADYPPIAGSACRTAARPP